MPRRSAMAVWGILFIVAAWSLPVFAAERTEAEEEAIRQKELDLERENPGKPLFEVQMSGKVVLYSTQLAQALEDGVEGRNLGHFVSEKGRAYILRGRGPSILDALRASDGKTVLLAGRIEIEGKYFVAETVLASQPPPPVRTKRNGL